MASLFRRFFSLLRLAPSQPPRIFFDASTFNPEDDCGIQQAVVIMTCDEESTIYERVFQARKLSQSVVVLDQGSRDSTPYLAAQAGAIVVLQEPGQSSESAMQKAMHVARKFSENVRVIRS